MNALGEKEEGGEAVDGERRRNETKILSLPLFNAHRHAEGHVLTDGTHPTQRNVTRLKWDVAWVGPTTTTTQA